MRLLPRLSVCLLQVNIVVGRLSAMRRFRDSGSVILPLHSALSASDQRRVFQRPPGGARKVVVATNIAETSLTIPDVVYVVDSGRQKCRQYDPRRGMSSLEARAPLVRAFYSVQRSRACAGGVGLPGERQAAARARWSRAAWAVLCAVHTPACRQPAVRLLA